MSKQRPNICGVVTVGAKGQIVIPADVRENAGIVPGDRLFVLAKPGSDDMIGLCTQKGLEDLMEHMNEKLTHITDAVNSVKEEKA